MGSERAPLAGRLGDGDHQVFGRGLGPDGDVVARLDLGTVVDDHVGVLANAGIHTSTCRVGLKKG
jgi:hypothetical protein